MTCIRPATPGFVVTLVATALLAVVSFCVPYFKSVYFLRADINIGSNHGAITFGTLGYCLELSNGTTCSSPSIGYQLDINGLVGNKFSVQIPQVVVKWITYALFLHVVGLILAAISAIFGLLAHVREMSMACCSTCVSGFAAGITLIAFIFDIALFFIAKARINAVGHASMGNAIWLTLAAWILLFFSGCFFTLGRCCIQKRGPRSKWGKKDDRETAGPDSTYAEQMRMEAIKAEAERKARHAGGGGGGLPVFYETVPLTGRVEGDSIYTDKDETTDTSTPTVTSHRPQNTGYTSGGYAPAPQGSRAVDEYYNPTSNAAASSNTYPPPPHHPSRQASGHSHSPSTYFQNSPSPGPHRQASGYTPTSAHPNAPLRTSPPPANSQYLSAAAYQDPYTTYGHTAGGSSYHTATSHNQQLSSYSQPDQYNNYRSQSQPQTTHYSEPSFNPDIYNSTGILNTSSSPPIPAANTSTPYNSATPNPYTSYNARSPPAQQYTLSGDGYGANTVPPLPEENSSPYLPYSRTGPSSSSHATPTQPHSSSYATDDAPPGYDAGTSGVTGRWGKH